MYTHAALYVGTVELYIQNLMQILGYSSLVYIYSLWYCNLLWNAFAAREHPVPQSRLFCTNKVIYIFNQYTMITAEENNLYHHSYKLLTPHACTHPYRLQYINICKSIKQFLLLFHIYLPFRNKHMLCILYSHNWVHKVETELQNRSLHHYNCLFGSHFSVSNR